MKQVARDSASATCSKAACGEPGTDVRITAQLIDAANRRSSLGRALRPRPDRRLCRSGRDHPEFVAAIEPKLLEAEGVRSQNRSAEDLGAWDMVIHANSLFWRLTKTEGDAAITMLWRAVERYPDNGPAHSMLAFMMLLSQLTGWNIDEALGKQAATLAARAAELDDSDPWAHLALGYVAFTMRRTDAAVEEFERALDLNSNFAIAHGYLGLALSLAGRSDEAIAHCEQAIRMSPHDPQNAIFNTAIAAAHYLAGRYMEAVAFGRKALQQRTQFTSGHRIYVAALAQAGQLEEAREALKQLKELSPAMTIAWIQRYVP